MTHRGHISRLRVPTGNYPPQGRDSPGALACFSSAVSCEASVSSFVHTLCSRRFKFIPLPFHHPPCCCTSSVNALAPSNFENLLHYVAGSIKTVPSLHRRTFVNIAAAIDARKYSMARKFDYVHQHP